MSLETLTAARIYKAQQYGTDCKNTNTDQRCYGEETLLDFEKFPHTGFSKVRTNFVLNNLILETNRYIFTIYRLIALTNKQLIQLPLLVQCLLV